MFPGGHSRLFRSRWAALLWSAGILWTAIEVAGTPDHDDDTPAAAANLAGDGALNVAEFDETARLVRELGR